MSKINKALFSSVMKNSRCLVLAVIIMIVLNLFLTHHILTTTTTTDISILPRSEQTTSSGSRNADDASSISNDKTPLSSLSNHTLFLSRITELYNKYGHEITSYRPFMRDWCNRTRSCKFCDYEVEMLYMLIREYKPQRVFEMAPNLGYSTHWILQALHKNDNTSELHSYDIHEKSKKWMKQEFESRWKFTLGDYAKLYDSGELIMDEYDFIFIDALHEPAFSRGYCKRILAQHKRKAVVAIHDIVDANGDGRESSEVYKHVAMNNYIHNVFTMADQYIPNFVHPIEGIITKINDLRVKQGVIKPCKPNCHKSGHDTLYIETNNSPTIFFELNYT